MRLPMHLIEFPADDPDRARCFWTGLLGVELVERSGGEGEVCASKRRFATEAEARAAALWDLTQFGERLSCYRCEECDGWHLTGGRGRSHE